MGNIEKEVRPASVRHVHARRWLSRSHTAHTKKSMAAWHVTNSSVSSTVERVIQHKSTKASRTKQVGEGGAPVVPELLQVHWVELNVGQRVINTQFNQASKAKVFRGKGGTLDW